MAAQHPPGASVLQLRPRTESTFDLVSGTAEHLAQYLETRGYLRTRLKDPTIERYRLAGELRGAERAWVRILHTGTVQVQGTPRGVGATLLLLGLLVAHPAPAEPMGTQLELFEVAR